MKSSNDFCLNTFSNPPKENNLIYTWIWNEPVNTEIINNQLEEFAKAGIKGIYILPMPKEFRPTTMKTSMTPSVLIMVGCFVIDTMFLARHIQDF